MYMATAIVAVVALKVVVGIGGGGRVAEGESRERRGCRSRRVDCQL